MDNSEIKVSEDRFVSRLHENLIAFENAGRIQESDNLAELRKLTGGKLLRAELEAKYPLGKTLSMRITPKAGLFAKEKRSIILMGKVIVRLDRFVEKGSDDEPISLSELNTILSKESDIANRSCYESVLGLYSPTEWNNEAKAFIENNPPGSGWASNRVHPVLIGPEITQLMWDKKSSKISNYIQCFCGLTLAERQQVCKDIIKRAILVQEFANLAKIAAENGFSLDFVKKVGKELTSCSKELVFSKVTGVGFVVKKKI